MGCRDGRGKRRTAQLDIGEAGFRPVEHGFCRQGMAAHPVGEWL